MKKIIYFIFYFSSFLYAQESSFFDRIKEQRSKVETVQLLFPILKELNVNENNPKLAQKQILDALWALEKDNKLKPQIKELVKIVKSENKAPALQAMPDQYLVEMLHLSLLSEFYGRGYSNPSYKFSDWDTLHENHLKRLLKFQNLKINSSEFKNAIKSLSGESFSNISKIENLSSNEVSFKKRIELIKNAKKSIKLMSWGYHDDASGKNISDALIKAKNVNPKLEIQLIVDYQVAQRLGYKDEISRLKKNRIDIIEWKSTINPFYGFHTKMLLIDDQFCLEGGRNIGDSYLLNKKWTDFDIYHEGKLASEKNVNIFSKVWNEQIALQNLTFKKLKLKTESINDEQNENALTLLSYPKPNSTDKIYDISVMSIMNAKKQIDIANAYYVATPGIRLALINALKRGVKVRIISNSMKSVDEPIVSIPIQESLKELYENGAEVYLKNGQTLHTKLLIVDGFSWTGSYNLHPRSVLYEVEKVVFLTETSLTNQLKNVFNNLLKEGSKVNSTQDFELPEKNPGMDLLFQLIFNQI